MTPSLKKASLLFVLFTGCGFVLATMLEPESVAGARTGASDAYTLESSLSGADDLKPVDNMHHFMEYIYEPVFNDLKELVKEAPADKKGWTALKSKSLILAESSILLADRPDEKGDADSWKEASVLVHRGGSALYQAARKKDFEGVKKGFAAMINGCKKCHEEFR
ncbi:MAG: cytochrome c [Planctomycetota bacterium]|nr:cytochrome c [Planctomycetota bacterium]